MSENVNPEPVTPQPAEPVVNPLDLDPAEPSSAPVADLDAVDTPAPATPVAGPPQLNLGDPSQVAQATYGQTQQAYAQPQYSQAPQPGPSAPQPPYPGGYVPVPVAGGYVPLSWEEENTWAAAAHWSALVASAVGVGFLGPLLVYLIKGPQSARVKAAAAESLNFEITFIIAMIASLLAMFIIVGFVTIAVFPVLWLVLRIVAAVAASKGEDYRYPFAIRLVS
jgi:uncharacterized protein